MFSFSGSQQCIPPSLLNIYLILITIDYIKVNDKVEILGKSHGMKWQKKGGAKPRLDGGD